MKCPRPLSVCNALLAVSLFGCGDGASGEDGGLGVDGGRADAAPRDAASRDAGALDAGSADDGGALDAGADDGGALDAGADAGSVDAGSVDAGSVDAGPLDSGLDGGACGCLDDTLRWRFAGGLTPRRAESRIDACRTYTYTRTIGSGPAVSCEDEVPCESLDEVTVADVARALADRQVQMALTGTPIVYGRDTRPRGGQVFVIAYRGREITVGSPCAGTSGCIPIPAGIQTLGDVLESLEDERLEASRCAAVFPPT